jgi:SAM-dependent methyltransferase
MPGVLQYRLYDELSDWWPLISPPERYADEAAYLADLIVPAADGATGVLDLGCGGGHIAFFLKHRVTVTLVDISSPMLAVSRRLNPDCEHVLGDMRTVRLGRTFAAVLVHDAIDYMTTRADLRLAIETAFAHTAPGGTALFVPDHVADDFSPDAAGGGGSDGTGARASFVVRMHDPDPGDDWIAADYEFTLTRPDGTSRVVKETHRLGAFAVATWIELLRAAGPGWDVRYEGPGAPGARAWPGAPDHLFVCSRPGGKNIAAIDCASSSTRPISPVIGSPGSVPK